MTLDEFLERFFCRGGKRRGVPADMEVAVSCGTIEEVRAVMTWLMTNAGMTLADDHVLSGNPDFAYRMFTDDGSTFRNTSYRCVSCRTGHREWFDFYQLSANVAFISASEFFDIVMSVDNEVKQSEKPVGFLYGMQTPL